MIYLCSYVAELISFIKSLINPFCLPILILPIYFENLFVLTITWQNFEMLKQTKIKDYFLLLKFLDNKVQNCKLFYLESFELRLTFLSPSLAYSFSSF